MDNATRRRARAYLATRAAPIARAWAPHFGAWVPPQAVLRLFDGAVEDLIAIEPGLASASGYDETQRAELVSELLNVVIGLAREILVRERRARVEADRAADAARGTAFAGAARAVVSGLRGSPLGGSAG